ncbi:MAG: ribose 5-phosphate isomerase B [Cytophagaceae bacterium]|nr:ribose 5-phosphate isomerase B [Cytophagaceae bacterium]MDW8456274.1 ribose 5-phosphate isomerase B [Cytophagaceae bacterium]
MKIAIGGDHAGFLYKKDIIYYLTSKGYEVKDFGTFSEESVDYPDFAHPLATAVENNDYQLGILICGSGNGVNITANKHKGIRSGLAWRKEVAALIREHNDANIMALPARFISLDTAIECVDAFLNAKFEGGKHERRVQKIHSC